MPGFKHIQAANVAGFRASEDPRFEAGIPDFINGILNFSIHFNVVHRKVDWRNPKMKSLNSMPAYTYAYRAVLRIFSLNSNQPTGYVPQLWPKDSMTDDEVQFLQV